MNTAIRVFIRLGLCTEVRIFAHRFKTEICNYDNNQHAENENVILQYLWNGVETMSVIMLMK